MAVMDSNKNGYIDYTEFIAACLQSYNYLQENHLKTAFSYFDKDGSGSISLEELKQCLQNEDFTLPEDAITKLLREVDINDDKEVIFVFVAYLNIDRLQRVHNNDEKQWRLDEEHFGLDGRFALMTNLLSGSLCSVTLIA